MNLQLKPSLHYNLILAPSFMKLDYILTKGRRYQKKLEKKDNVILGGGLKKQKCPNFNMGIFKTGGVSMQICHFRCLFWVVSRHKNSLNFENV